MNFQSLHLDVLHLLDLGVSSHILGNLLWSVLEDQLPGNREVALVQLNKLIAEGYNELGVPVAKRVGHLSLSNVNKSSATYPVLKHLKGRKIKDFTQVGVWLAEKFVKADDPSTQHRLLLVKALQEVYACTDRPELKWPASTQARFLRSVDKLLLHYGWLARHSFEKEQCRYSVVQKFHLLAHFGQQTRYLAPRAAWTYGSESYMGLISQLASSCTNNTPGAKISSFLVAKYRYAMHLIVKGIFAME